jgi:hypothetical protein
MTVTDETCIAKDIRRAYWFYAKVEIARSIRRPTSARLAQEAEGASGRVIYFRPNNSGSFATLAAIRRA